MIDDLRPSSLEDFGGQDDLIKEDYFQMVKTI